MFCSAPGVLLIKGGPTDPKGMTQKFAIPGAASFASMGSGELDVRSHYEELPMLRPLSLSSM